MKTAILAAVAMILVIELLYSPFVELDQCSYAVGRMISSLTLSTEPVDQIAIVSSLHEILDSKDDVLEARWSILLTGILFLVALFCLRNGQPAASAPDKHGEC